MTVLGCMSSLLVIIIKQKYRYPAIYYAITLLKDMYYMNTFPSRCDGAFLLMTQPLCVMDQIQQLLWYDEPSDCLN